MPGDITDVYTGAKHDPALAIGSGDPQRKLSFADHSVELPPVYAGETTHQADYFEEESILPTEEELQTLRRVADHIPWRAYTIAFVELVERMSYYGTTQVFVNFIQQPNPGTATGKAVDPGAADAQPGALGLGQQASTGLTTFNQFWVYVIPLFGAYVADTYLGRYKTIVFSVCIALVGHVILTASAAPSVIASPHSSLAAFIIGLIIMGIGTGGFKPNISPLVAEQIPRQTMHVKELKTGERVIVDPAVTTARVYNWFYLFINIGALVGQVGMSYAERYVGFYLSFLIPTVCFITTFPVLWFCRKYYNRRAPEGSVLGPAIKILWTATKGRWHLNPVASYKHMNDGTFWDSVKPSSFGPNKPKWMTFDDAWVDEVARGWSACSVFLWYPLYWITYNQINGNLTSQAATMSLHGIPNDILSNLDPFALIILIPICDLLVYPFLRKRGIRFTPIKKIAAGFFTGSASMIWAAVVQHYIYKTSTCGSHAGGSDCSSPINVWAQTGSYVLIALSEIFASITSLEYGFSKAPKNMRSLVAAFALFMTAISAAIGEAFVPLSTDPLLVWNYGSMAVVSFIAGCIFWFQYRQLDKDEDRLNMLPTGHVGTQNQLADVERRLSVVAADKEKI
ncbi:MFS peptide transporter-like protein Ptr2 [Lepidopterella palustris CBS 459.81]|uniref:MFS peptide transporter-like protein Ptr2 n=1 Tax=Lepidopterella palustris CBS 459.81 TaxID=1314670 RepID=A0A8E2JDF8_9PEZI|nr:MFS peptide transporter-like protein Ptr2 [Lepidopterella palustris CBS 459.81]